MKNKIIHLTLMLLLIATMTIGQTDSTALSTPSLSLSGSVDAYFRSNLSGDYDAAPGTSFANLPGFSLGMVNLILAQEGESFGFTADLVMGPRGEDATFLSSELRPGGSSNIVNQLFAYWQVTENLKFTLGNFNTFLGYEVISPVDNFNYSTSYMFSYGPFSHTGLKVDLTLGNGFSVMGGIFNPTDATEYNPTNSYAGGLQLGYDNDGLSVFVNGLFAEDYMQFDITAGYDFTEKLYLGLNSTMTENSFYGVATYVQYAVSDDLALGVRGEYFKDNGLGIFEGEGEVYDITATAQYQIGSLVIIPEVRLDMFSENIVPDDGALTSDLSSFVLAVVYGF